MRKKNKIIPIIIVIIMILIIGTGSFAYVYFYTDMLKTDKQKFFKYFAKNFEILSDFKFEELKSYSEKKKTTGYEYEGDLTTQIDKQTAALYMPSEKIYNEVQKSKIIFEGQKDIPNKYAHSVIGMEYSNGEKMTFEYINEDDYYGIKVGKILKKYLVLENKNLEEFAEKLQLPISANVPDTLDTKNIEEYKLTDEEIKIIKDKIYLILEEKLTDAMFREEKFGDELKYTLSMTVEQIEDITAQIYEAVINDETIIQKIKKYFIQELKMNEEEANEEILEIKKSAEEYKEEISDKLEEYDADNNSKTQLVQISVYQNKGILTNTEIITDEEKISLNKKSNIIILKLEEASKDGESIVYNPAATVSLEKIKEVDSLTYKLEVSIDEIDVRLEFDINYQGIDSLDKIKEQYTMSVIIDNEDKNFNFKYILKNDVTFKDYIENENVISNGVKINNYDREKLLTTFTKLR